MTKPTKSPTAVHIVLGGANGNGKSMVSRLVGECLLRTGVRPLCIDTDPSNESLAGVVALPVREIPLIGIFDGVFDVAHLDLVVDTIIEENRPTVIDTGAGAFGHLLDHFVNYHMMATLTDAGFDVYLHSIVGGGDAYEYSIRDLVLLLELIGTRARQVVWLNPALGTMHQDGKPFEDWDLFKRFKDDIAYVLTVAPMTGTPFAADFAELLRTNQTFSAAVKPSSELPLLQRARLKSLGDNMLDAVAEGIKPKALERA